MSSTDKASVTPSKRTVQSKPKKVSAGSADKSSVKTNLRDEVIAYRKDLILKAACDAFYEHGYHDCTVDMIAERLSGTKAIVYYYFTDKHSILYELYKRALDEAQYLIHRAATENDDARAKLAAIARSYATWVIGNTRVVGVYWREIQSLSEEARAAVLAEQKKIDDAIAQVIREGVASGAFQSSDVQTTARSIAGMITFTYVWWRNDKRLSAEAAADLYAQMALRVVGVLD
jgi:AcrR family transcriptional regulator